MEGTDYKALLAQLKEKFEGIKNFFAAPIPPAAPMQPVNPAAPVAYTLEDGTPVEIPMLQVGQPVTMGGQSLPDGDYKLNTGDTIKVTQGLIAEIEPAAPMTPQTPATPQIPQQMTQEQFDAAIAEYKTGFESQISTLKETAKNEKVAFDTVVTDLKEKFTAAEAEINKQKATIEKLFDLVEKITELPKVDPVVPPRAGFVSTIKNRDEKLQSIGANIKKVKEK